MVIFCNPSFANDGHFTPGYNPGAPFSKQSKYIKMVSEKVTFKNNKIETIFVFKNLKNKPQKISIGFPIDGPRNSKILNNEAVQKQFNFQTTIDGKKEKRNIKRIQNKKGKHRYVFFTKILFKPGQTIEVKNTYTQEPESASSTIVFYYNEISYIASTGSSWAGVIDHGEFIFHIPIEKDINTRIIYEPGVVGSRLLNFIITNQKKAIVLNVSKKSSIVRLVYKKYKPDFDLKIHWGTVWNPVEVFGFMYFDFFTNINDYLGNISDQTKSKFFYQMVDTLKDRKDDYFHSILTLIKIKYFLKDSKAKHIYKELPIEFLENSLLALHGYSFTDKNYQTFFSRFNWYKPGTNKLSKEELSIKYPFYKLLKESLEGTKLNK